MWKLWHAGSILNLPHHDLTREASVEGVIDTLERDGVSYAAIKPEITEA